VTTAWDLDADGVYGETGAAAGRGDEAGMAPTFSVNGRAGPATVTVSLRVTDNDGLSSTTTATVQVSNQSLLLPDPASPGRTALFVGGTSGNDTIVFSPSGNTGDVTVMRNGVTLGTYHPTGRIVVYGNDGNDDIQVAGSITLPAWLYGGKGDDRLKGGNGNNVLIAGVLGGVVQDASPWR